MAELKIRATADVGAAKSSIRELTQEEARRVVQEREANQRRRQDFAETTRAQLQAAREAGNASKRELEDLRRANRIAAADMKASAREVADARRDAARVDAQARVTDDLLQDLRQGRGSVVRRRSSREVLARSGIRDELEHPTSVRKGVSQMAEPAMAIGALTAALAPLTAAIVSALERVDAALKAVHEGKMEVAEAQTSAARKMRDNGMTDTAIAQVFKSLREQGGVLSEKDMVLQIDDAMEKGAATPDGILSHIRDRAAPKEYTANQRVANALARARRQAEREQDTRLRNAASAAADREAIHDVSVLEYSDPDGARGNALAVKMLAEVWRRRGLVRDATGASAGPVEVRLSDDQLRRLGPQTPLLGE